MVLERKLGGKSCPIRPVALSGDLIGIFRPQPADTREEDRHMPPQQRSRRDGCRHAAAGAGGGREPRRAPLRGCVRSVRSSTAIAVVLLHAAISLMATSSGTRTWACHAFLHPSKPLGRRLAPLARGIIKEVCVCVCECVWLALGKAGCFFCGPWRRMLSEIYITKSLSNLVCCPSECKVRARLMARRIFTF